MALTRTNHASIQDALTTASFTTPSNSVLVVVAGLIRNNLDTFTPSGYTISNTGTALTFSQRLVVAPDVAYSPGLIVWTAPVTTGESITVTIARPGGDDPAVHSVLRPISWAGGDTGSPVGVTASASQTTPTDGSFNPSLSGSPASSSEVFAILFGTTNATVNVTPGTGWTELREENLNDWFTYQDQVRAGSTTASVLWDDVLAPSSTGTWFNDRTSFAALEIKDNLTGPTINTQPSNSTVTAPATANFTVAATTSGGTLLYQWQRSDNGGGSWGNVSTGTGGTTTSYTTAATNAAAAGSGGDNNAQFRCVVTDDNGSVNTNAAILTVNSGTVVPGIRNFGPRGALRTIVNL